MATDFNTANQKAEEIMIILHAGTTKPGYRYHHQGRAADRLKAKGLINIEHNVDRNCITLTSAGQGLFDKLLSYITI